MSDKPQVTATIRFRGVTIEDMTIEELRALRDVLNDIVGEKVVERIVQRDVWVGRPYPYWSTTPMWTVSNNTTGGNKITLGNTAGNSTHYNVCLS